MVAQYVCPSVCQCVTVLKLLNMSSKVFFEFDAQVPVSYVCDCVHVIIYLVSNSISVLKHTVFSQQYTLVFLESAL